MFRIIIHSKIKRMKKLYTLLFLSAISLNQSFSQNCNFICNGSFDNPYMVSTAGLTVSLNCWNTTATDGLMEVWGNGYNGVNSYSGIQFVELNATQAATLYQDFFVTNPGTNLNISFAHRARTNPGLTDTVQVSIGPVGGPYTILGNYGDGPSAWGYYSVNYITPAPGNYRIRFTPTYYSYGNPGIGNFLDAVSVCLEQGGTGINEITNVNAVSVYPNPANQTITLKFDNTENNNFTLNLYDQQGRLVKTVGEITTDELKLERENLNTGLYFYTLTSKAKTVTGKFCFVD